MNTTLRRLGHHRIFGFSRKSMIWFGDLNRLENEKLRGLCFSFRRHRLVFVSDEAATMSRLKKRDLRQRQSPGREQVHALREWS